MVRTTLGAEVETTVTVTGSETVDFLKKQGTSSVPDGSSETLVVRPPQGFVYELLTASISISSVSSTASGTHRVLFQAESKGINQLQIQQNGDTGIFYGRAHIIGSNVQAQPPDTAAQTLAVRGLRASDSSGFQFKYRNLSGETQNSNRRYKLWVRQIQVSE